MTIIIGGAYQGKTAYATEQYGLSADDIFPCENETHIDFSKRCINGFHLLVLAQLQAGIDPVGYIRDQLNTLNTEDRIIIIDDISCGVVPMDPLMRLWREALGYTLAVLTRDASRVQRIFCGLANELK